MKKYLPIAASVLLLAACSEKPGYEITGTVSNSDLNGKYTTVQRNFPIESTDHHRSFSSDVLV